MLQQPADFPNSGSIAYLRHTAQPCRIIQHKPEKQVLVSMLDRHGVPLRDASGRKTVELAEIFPDAETASFGSVRAAARARRSRAAGRAL